MLRYLLAVTDVDLSLLAFGLVTQIPPAEVQTLLLQCLASWLSRSVDLCVVFSYLFTSLDSCSSSVWKCCIHNRLPHVHVLHIEYVRHDDSIRLIPDSPTSMCVAFTCIHTRMPLHIHMSYIHIHTPKCLRITCPLDIYNPVLRWCISIAYLSLYTCIHASAYINIHAFVVLS